MSETEKKVYTKSQRFPQAIIQAGQGAEEEEPVDNPVVEAEGEEEGAEQSVDQPALEEPGQQEAQFVFLSLSVVCLLEDSRYRGRELMILALFSW